MKKSSLYEVYDFLVENRGPQHPNAILCDAALRYDSTPADNVRCRFAAFNAVKSELTDLGYFVSRRSSAQMLLDANVNVRESIDNDVLQSI